MDKNNNILHKHDVVLNNKTYTLVTIDTAKQVRVVIAPQSLDDELCRIDEAGYSTQKTYEIEGLIDYVVPDRYINEDDVDSIISLLLIEDPLLFVARP